MAKKIEDKSSQSNFDKRSSDFGFFLVISNYYCNFFPGATLLFQYLLIKVIYFQKIAMITKNKLYQNLFLRFEKYDFIKLIKGQKK